jgi:hypothetical protein
MNIYCIIKGCVTKNAIIFICVNALNSLFFQEQFNSLKNIFLLAVDLPGYGLSEKVNNNFFYSLSRYISVVKQVIKNN